MRPGWLSRLPAPRMEVHRSCVAWMGDGWDEDSHALAAHICLTAACAQARWCRKCLAWHAAQSGDGWLEEARGAMYFTTTIKVSPRQLLHA